MMKRSYHLFMLLAVLPALIANVVNGQNIPYRNGHKTWDPDKLGNQRAVVTVTGEGKVAEAVIPWRCRKVTADQQIIVIDAKTGQLVNNVKAKNVSQAEGVVDFEPVSGQGTYYVYFLPYELKKPVNYPNAIYKKMTNTASADWEQLQASSPKATAKVDYFESFDALNSFYPMEVIATPSEQADVIKSAGQQSYLVFPEHRIYPIKMDTILPERWVGKAGNLTFTDTACRGEHFAYQLGVYAFAKKLDNVKVEFSALKDGSGNIIPVSQISCLNTEGISAKGQPMKKTVDVEQGHIQAMWCLVNVSSSAKAGTYAGTATVSAAGQPSQVVNIEVTIQDKVLADGGAGEPWKQTRLTWLNSTLAQQNTVIAPYTALKVNQHTISLLGRKLTLNENGFPNNIDTYFTEEMTSIGTVPNHVLAHPFEFTVKGAGKVEKWQGAKLNIKQTEPGTVTWTSTGKTSDVSMAVNGRIEFDGFVNYEVKITALKDVNLDDIQMVIPFSKAASHYMMGLNEKGTKLPESYEWKWDVAHKAQDGAWVGNVNAGLQFSLRDEKYVRPLNTNFYLAKPLLLPTSWGNEGKGGINISQNAAGANVTSYSGERSMKKGEVLYYNFTLMVTPFHPLNTAQQWDLRFYHKYTPVDSIKMTGATVINIHHGTAINPYINYPFIAWRRMKSYIDSAHQLGLKVKIYNTVRELSNSAYETFPMRSLGHEIYTPGKGGGYSWLQEHLGGDYIAAWYVPEQHDAAIINSGLSRWHNYYVEGMNWLVNNVGIDGIYLDDVAFDRTTMKRIKRVLTQNGHPGIIDLHSANQYNKSDGFNNSANLYLEHFPYLNRLWFGEYFDYEKNDPNFFMVEVSGIPYGLMGEMLQGGGNPWRGMIYGMTNRMPWSDNADPRPIWKVWDEFGIKGSRMIGYWVSHNPVKTNNSDVLATIYVKGKKVLISIASWAPEDTKIKLNIDWKALGIDPSKATLTAPEIKNFQPAKTFGVNDEIPVEQRKGWLLILK